MVDIQGFDNSVCQKLVCSSATFRRASVTETSVASPGLVIIATKLTPGIARMFGGTMDQGKTRNVRSDERDILGLVLSTFLTTTYFNSVCLACI